ncbi:MAG: efflux RND transporter periplasmic adaptor subunit [Melioribacteraceae bacterium]|nr:efflux RND transporter periplasmic adaptor subunit [Melioribacteraceae bacterium]
MNYKSLRKTIISILLLFLISSCGNTENPGTDKGENKHGTPTVANDTKAVPVEAIIASIKTVEQRLPLSGITQPLNSVDLISEASGKVKVLNKKLGEYVSTKDTLAIVDDRVPKSQFLQAKSQLLSAENNLMIAKLNLESDKELFENGDISKLAYENSVLNVKTAEANKLSAEASLSALEKSFYDTRITAPINGLISRKNIELGTMVSPGMNVYRVVDLKTIKINVGVPQDVISRVELGNKAEVIISALNNKSYNGVVKFISPQADETTGAFNIEIHVSNDPGLSIKAGMTAKLELLLETATDVLSVPEYALVPKNNEDYIYKVENGIALLTKIKIKEIIGSNVLIENNIEVGDTIVTVGMKNLGTKTKVFVEVVN